MSRLTFCVLIPSTYASPPASAAATASQNVVAPSASVRAPSRQPRIVVISVRPARGSALRTDTDGTVLAPRPAGVCARTGIAARTPAASEHDNRRERDIICYCPSVDAKKLLGFSARTRRHGAQPGTCRLRLWLLTPARTWILCVMLVPISLLGLVGVIVVTELPVGDGFLNVLVPIISSVAFIGCTVAMWRSSSHWSLKLLGILLATPLAIIIGVLIALAVMFHGVH